MNTSRRDLLKYFGIGTVIAPVVGGAPAATLIEVPKVEIVAAKALPEPFDTRQIHSFSIVFTLEDGSRRTIDSNYCNGGMNVHSDGILHPGFSFEVAIHLKRLRSFSPSTFTDVARWDGEGTLL